MKKIKKTTANLLTLSLTAALFAVPTVASAESYHGVSFTPPSGYNGYYDAEDDVYYYDSNGDDETVIRVSYDNEFIADYQINSVKEWTDMQWLDWVEEDCGGPQYTHGNLIAYFETIGGYDFVRIHYGDIGYDGKKWYCTYMIGGPGCMYTFNYYSLDPAKPSHQAFLDMVRSAGFGGSTPAAPQDNTIKIYVNGNRIISDADPVIVNERTLVPIRAVAEAMGCKVDWLGSTRTVRISKGDMTVDLIVDDTLVLKMWSGGFQEIYADVPAQIMNERTFVPVRVVSEAFGAVVDWDGATQSVFITN